jgi:hypothetical protein
VRLVPGMVPTSWCTHRSRTWIVDDVTPARCMQSVSHVSEVTLVWPALMKTKAVAPVDRGRAQMLTELTFPVLGDAVVKHLQVEHGCGEWVRLG